MEFEALFLALEPLAALAIGAGAVVAIPAIDAIGNALGKETKLSESLAESTKEFTKKALVFGIETLETALIAYAEAEESFRDLVADAKAEHLAKKASESSGSQEAPREVEIVSE